MKVTLKDGAPRCTGQVEINVSKNGNTVEIGVTGVDPAPVVLEFYGGKLNLRLFSQDGKPIDSWSIITAPPTAYSQPPSLTEAVIQSNAIAAAEIVIVGNADEHGVSVGDGAEFDETAFDAA